MYPQTVILQNGMEIELWPMTPDDAPALLEFYRSLPPADLLYLREDVTSTASMRRWVEGIERRFVVDRMFRQSGLSRHITNEILAQAVDEGLYKVLVQMAVNQRSAIHMFEQVGFCHEAVLKDHAKDQHGELRDLVIMAFFTRDFLTQTSE